ncbi:MAG: DUF1848 family protein [Candidatus Zixiibacteriota bacterium]
MKHKLVISASRRTELLAFYPDYLCQRITEICPENIHTLVVWTRDPSNLWENRKIHDLLKRIDQVYVLLTLTGLAGTVLEPHSPPSDRIVELLPKTIDFVNSPDRVAWRYDPLIKINSLDGSSITNIEKKRFLELSEKIVPLGITRIITSGATIYKKTERNLRRFGLEADPALDGKAFEFIDSFLKPYCLQKNIQLSTCVIPPSSNFGCIDGRLLEKLHPEKLPCSLTKDRTQRENCRCTKSIDIGQWFRCPHGCVYCYGNPKIEV